MAEQTETLRQREVRAREEWDAVHQIFELYTVRAGPRPTRADYAQWYRLNDELHAAVIERIGSE